MEPAYASPLARSRRENTPRSPAPPSRDAAGARRTTGARVIEQGLAADGGNSNTGNNSRWSEFVCEFANSLRRDDFATRCRSSRRCLGVPRSWAATNPRKRNGRRQPPPIGPQAGLAHVDIHVTPHQAEFNTSHAIEQRLVLERVQYQPRYRAKTRSGAMTLRHGAGQPAAAWESIT